MIDIKNDSGYTPFELAFRLRNIVVANALQANSLVNLPARADARLDDEMLSYTDTSSIHEIAEDLRWVKRSMSERLGIPKVECGAQTEESIPISPENENSVEADLRKRLEDAEKEKLEVLEKLDRVGDALMSAEETVKYLRTVEREYYMMGSRKSRNMQISHRAAACFINDDISVDVRKRKPCSIL